MKQITFILLFAGITGCASDRAVLPVLDGKPRVKINSTASQQSPVQQQTPLQAGKE